MGFDAVMFEKLKLFSFQAWTTIKGFPRFFAAHPLFAIRLLILRLSSIPARRVYFAVKTPAGLPITTNNQLMAYWSMFVGRELWHPEWIEALEEASRPVVLDIGANTGIFSHLVCTINPSAHCLAFEPLPEMVAQIESLAAQTGNRITCHRKAVSDFNGTGMLHAATPDDGTSTLREGVEKDLAFPVDVVTLDSVVGEGDILLAKIDVEDLECEVIRGGRKTLGATRFLIVEAHGKEALERVRTVLGREWRDRKVGYTDYLFSRVRSC